MKKSSKPRPPSELETLRARLEEAEQTLEAIRSGQVDALVVSSSEGERVFTLQGADHRYRQIVEGMTEGALIVSARGVILYANSSFARLVAKPLDRVLGSALRQYVPRTSSSAFEGLLRDARGGTAAAESSLLTASGSLIPIHVSATLEGEPDEGGVCLIVTDLTGAVQEAEHRFQFVADMLPQIMWSARSDGWLDYYNRRWFEYTGMTLVQTQGHGWGQVVCPEDLPGCEKAWARSVETGEPFQMTYRIKRASDGAYRWHLGHAIPQRGANGAILRWYGTCTDIENERSIGEEASRARQKAEEATRLKDEFLATLSHELRTPLNAILGWSRLLQAEATPPERRKQALASIVRNAHAQTQLIDDLLDVSRIVSGKLRLNMDIVDAASVVEAAVDVVQPAADAKGVRVKRNLDPETGFVPGDPTRLQQVVWNLVSNAVKFTPRGGQVEVSARSVDSCVEIAVTDSGSGISREFLPYVFDRFRQQNGTIARTMGGLGLGLSIVRSIVELHGGTVEAHSDGDGRGSRFVVRVPLAPGHTAELLPPNPTAVPSPPPSGPRPLTYPSALARLKILVVDDEADARELLQVVLQQGDVSVFTAGSAAEALEMIETFKPDVIVSDIGMPGDDGYGFIRKLRQRPRASGGSTPAVALTAYARPEDRCRALREGFQSHAVKPIDPQELLGVIADLVDRSH